MDIGATAQVAGSLAACAAAIASWRAVLQSRTIYEASMTPVLTGTVAGSHQLDRLIVDVHNVGGGLAKNSTVVLASDGAYVSNAIGGAGLLPGNGSAKIVTGLRIPPTGRAAGVLVCNDFRHRVYAWELTGKRHKVFRRLPRRGMSEDDIWKHFFPDQPLDGLLRAPDFGAP